MPYVVCKHEPYLMYLMGRLGVCKAAWPLWPPGPPKAKGMPTKCTWAHSSCALLALVQRRGMEGELKQKLTLLQ